MEENLGTKPLFGLLLKTAVPTMLSMLIQSLYNIVDGIFVNRMDPAAFNAVTFVYPLQNMILAVAVGLGVGLNSHISRALGAGDRKEADGAATHGLILAALHYIPFLIAGLFAVKPFLTLFTQEQTVLAYGQEYGTIVLCFSCFSLVHIAIEKLFQSTGNTTFPMLMQALGAVVNLALDPVLIFGAGKLPAMGVAGAAIATVLGQACACICSIVYFFAKGNGLRVSFKGFRFRAHTLARVYAVAVPSALMMAMPSLLVGIMNAILDGVSDGAVNFFGIYYKLQTLVYSPASGLVQGMRPVVGYNFGAKKYARMNGAIWLSVAMTAAFVGAVTVLFLAAPKQILLLFGAEGECLQIGARGLRVLCSGFVVSSLGVILPGAFEALGMGVRSLAVTLVRQLAIPPLALLLLPLCGLTGAWVAFPLAETVAAASAAGLYSLFYKKLRAPRV